MRNHASALLQTGKVNQLAAGTGRGEILRRDFFQRDPLSCARDLIGCELNWNSCAGLIVETEAYNAIGDEACHCFVRPSTRAFVHDVHRLCSGPGKLTQALAITGRYDEMDLCGNENHCFRRPAASFDVVADERIGIRRSAHLPWRFTLRDSAHVSRKVRTERSRRGTIK